MTPMIDQIEAVFDWIRAHALMVGLGILLVVVLAMLVATLGGLGLHVLVGGA